MDSSVGLHRVREPFGVLPQAAIRLDPTPEIGVDEVRVQVQRLNLDAASFHQLHQAHHGNGQAVRQAVCNIIAERGKMHNPVTGSGGMLIGKVQAVGAQSPLGLQPEDRIATLVSLTLTPLSITDGLADWDGHSPQVPCQGHAILFARSAVAKLPTDLAPQLALAALDVCGAPALTSRVVAEHRRNAGPDGVTVAVIGAAGKSGSLALAAARHAGARTVGVVPTTTEQQLLAETGLADTVTLADARDPVALARQITHTLGRGADVTVVCVDVPGCEHGAILATAAGGTVIFFSMTTSFTAAALGAEGLAADVRMLIGNGYVPGHAAYTLELLRTEPAVRELIQTRLQADLQP